MASKMHAGVNYRDTHRGTYSLDEYPWYWKGDDGSILEYTEEEKEERARFRGSRGITDPHQ